MAGRDRPPAPPAEAAPEDQGFLGRWSRRKAEARAAEPSEAATAEEPAALTDASEGAEETATPAFDPSTLPDIDSLGRGSDFSVFMQAGVPQALKTKALRKLWRVKPELANLDGLLDYGEDLTGSFKTVDHLKTAYEVGRGFLRRAAGDDGAPPAETGGEAPPKRDHALAQEPEAETAAEAGDADPRERKVDNADA